MKNSNVLAPLFLEASNAISEHGSPISKMVATALYNAAQQPIIKPAHTVAQCKQLQYAYSQTTNTLNTLIMNLEHHIHWTDTGSGVKPKAKQFRSDLRLSNSLAPPVW